MPWPPGWLPVVGASNVMLNQMRWKTSVPRTLRPANVALPLATMVVGLTKRPDQLVVTLQSDVQFLDVWKTTREPRDDSESNRPGPANAQGSGPSAKADRLMACKEPDAGRWPALHQGRPPGDPLR